MHVLQAMSMQIGHIVILGVLNTLIIRAIFRSIKSNRSIFCIEQSIKSIFVIFWSIMSIYWNVMSISSVFFPPIACRLLKQTSSVVYRRNAKAPVRRLMLAVITRDKQLLPHYPRSFIKQCLRPKPTSVRRQTP